MKSGGRAKLQTLKAHPHTSSGRFHLPRAPQPSQRAALMGPSVQRHEHAGDLQSIRYKDLIFFYNTILKYIPMNKVPKSTPSPPPDPSRLCNSGPCQALDTSSSSPAVGARGGGFSGGEDIPNAEFSLRPISGLCPLHLLRSPVTWGLKCKASWGTH